MNARWGAYMREVTSGLTQVQIAHTVGVAQSAIGRWLGGEAPSAENVVKFCRAFGRNPVQGLVQAGFLETSEAGQTVELRCPLSDYSLDELLTELRRRAV